ncbi:MAG: hypothetical protein LBJ93_00385 [Clostridiales bacterium]|jgi:hypothetical protein|nr:hypothetical protein [Clostridiales bacterium]
METSEQNKGLLTENPILQDPPKQNITAPESPLSEILEKYTQVPKSESQRKAPLRDKLEDIQTNQMYRSKRLERNKNRKNKARDIFISCAICTTLIGVPFALLTGGVTEFTDDLFKILMGVSGGLTAFTDDLFKILMGVSGGLTAIFGLIAIIAAIATLHYSSKSNKIEKQKQNDPLEW